MGVHRGIATSVFEGSTAASMTFMLQVTYMGGMWDKGLLRFLNDPAIPIDINATERALRGIVGCGSLCVTWSSA